MSDINDALLYLKGLNASHLLYNVPIKRNIGKLTKVLVANRSEIAKKIFEALNQENIPSVAVVTDVDIDQSWYEMADEVVFIGEYDHYYSGDFIIAATILSGANAICPGYDFLSLNYNFVRKIEKQAKSVKESIIFMGANSNIIRAAKNRIEIKKMATTNNVPLLAWSDRVDSIFDDANKIGYPLMVKAVDGNRLKGGLPVFNEQELSKEISILQEANRPYYIEKYISKGISVKVQLFNDLALGSIKYLINKMRRIVIEETGNPFLHRNITSTIFAASEMMARAYASGNYRGFATVHFLFDHTMEKFGLLSFKPSLESGYSIVEETLGLDLLKWYILSYDGREQEIDYNYILKNRFLNSNHSIQCYVYAEDTQNNYIPSPGNIADITHAPFSNIRYDFGFSTGDNILADYNNVIGKIISTGKTREKALDVLQKAIDKIYIRGVDTNLAFISNVCSHEKFQKGIYLGSFLMKDHSFEKNNIGDAESRILALLGVLSNHVYFSYKLYSQSSFELVSNTFMLRGRSNFIPDTYSISLENGQYNYQVTLIQINLHTYYVFIDHRFFCSANIHAKIEQGNRYLIKFNSTTYKLRLDIQKNYIALKTWNDLSWSKFCKVKIISENRQNEDNSIGVTRASFQSNFVRLFDAKLNDKINKGSPIIMISAMKMETTIKAPISGRLTYLIENGDLSKLYLGKTLDGLVIGKNIKEGELLFVLTKEESSQKNVDSKQAKNRNIQIEVVSQFLINTQLKWLRNPIKNISSIYDVFLLIKSYLCGFINEANITPEFSESFLQFNMNQKFNLNELPSDELKKIETNIVDSIYFYMNIKLLHMRSYKSGRELSNFDEMSTVYLRIKERKIYFRDLSIKPILDDVFKYYGLNDWSFKMSKEFGKIQYTLWCIHKAFNICKKSIHIVKPLVEALFHLEISFKKKNQIFNELLEIEKENQDNTLYLFLLEKLNQSDTSSKPWNVDDKKKWPIEEWAEKTFDPNSFYEFVTDEIDSQIFLNPKTGKHEIKKVGSKIYLGKIKGIEACFYMKDSRVSGGATGNLEGLKYVVACCISFFKKIPLYIWNDGAGANIKEGMIALNRAAEGFIFNSLLGAQVTDLEFHNFIMNLPDKKIQSLYDKLREQFHKSKIQNNASSFIVAVGIGSSTGLDVYGASQTAIQIMLDSSVSYRVLTGSSVIKSVTGEDLSNYEIGGAKVMGHLTGTIDLVTNKKLELIQNIQDIHKIFAPEEKLKSIKRISKDSVTKKSSLNSASSLSVEVIKENVDDGEFIAFKENFDEAESVIGGFARIGGRHVLILGARTRFGIESLSSIIKCQELLDIAYKTGSSQIIFWGESNYQRSMEETPLLFRARKNLIQSLSQKKKIKIYVITHISSLYSTTINFFADVIIFVKQKNMSQKESTLIDKLSTFIVNSIPESFDLSHRLIHLLAPLGASQGRYKTSKYNAPIIPSDTTEPYDMIKNVIEKITDKGSFIEFFAGINDEMSGPALIIGMAEMDGNPIGILADQPKILGGAPESYGTEKFRLFVEFLEKNKVPLLMLSNSPGFLPGKKQELFRIQQIGGKSLDVNILSTIPVVSVVLNQNYGGRLIHAFGKLLRPGIVYLTLENSVLAVMGAGTSFDLFLKKKVEELVENNQKEEALELKAKYIKDFNEKSFAKNDAFDTGCIDWLIKDKKNMRDHIICGLQLATLRKQIMDGNNFLKDSEDELAVRKKTLELTSRVFVLNGIKATVENNSIILPNHKYKVLYEDIESFILGYQGLSLSNLSSKV